MMVSYDCWKWAYICICVPFILPMFPVHKIVWICWKPLPEQLNIFIRVVEGCLPDMGGYETFTIICFVCFY